MKKFISLIFAAFLVLQAGMVSVFADSSENDPYTIYSIDIGGICSTEWVEGMFPAVTVAESEHYSIRSQQWLQDGVVISGDNIAVAGGTYQYRLELSAENGFVFDNSLNGFNYQGVEGDYSLHYDFPVDSDDQPDNHRMIVTGEFRNILVASPISRIDLSRILAGLQAGDAGQSAEGYTVDDSNSWIEKVSEDSYKYQLVLNTNDGFQFTNTLQFLIDENIYGYSLNYDYDLSTNKHTLTIKGLAEKKQTEPADPKPDEKPGTTSLGPGTSAVKADKAIRNMAGDCDPKGSVFPKLKLRSAYQTNDSIKLTWTKPSKAKTYVIYGSKCGSSSKFKRLAVSTSDVKTIKKIGSTRLSKGKYYKFIIVALDSKSKVVSTSKVIYVATKGGKAGNYKSVSVSESVVSKAKKLKKGKSLSMKAKAVKQSAKKKVTIHAKLRYATSNKNIAAVSKKGVITAKKKGTCYVYAYAQNGVYKKIKVVVR